MQPLYVYIASECQKEAESYNISEQLTKLKHWVLHNKSLLPFEAFEYPYYVKKHLKWQYRLLARLDNINHDGNHYRILSFLRIYHRRDKDYEKIWIKTKAQCDVIFEDRIGHPQLQQFVAQSPSTQTIIDDSIHPIQRLTDYRIDTLNLSKNYTEFYYESPIWRHEIAPKLSLQQQKYSYQQLISALDKTQDIAISLNNDHIIDNTPPFKQYLPFIYHQDIKAHFSQKPYYIITDNTLDNTQNYIYYRKIPLELLSNEHLWYLSQKTQLPIELNDFQKQCIKALCIEHQDYPFIIQSPKNSGNSTLLALLYVHFYFKTTMHNALNCLLICQHYEKDYLKEQIKHHIKLYQHWHNINPCNDSDLEEILDKSCLSFKDYLYHHLNDDEKQKFNQQNYIDYIKFSQLYHQHYHPKNYYHHDIDKNYHSYFIWNIIRYIISYEDFSIIKIKNHTSIDKETINFIRKEIYEKWYLPLKDNHYYWDDADLVEYIEQQDIELTNYSVLLCDDSHLLPPNILTIILKQNIWLKQDNGLSISQIPLIFAYHQATVRTVYDWQSQLYQILNKIIKINQPNNNQELTHVSEIIDKTQSQHAINDVFYEYHKKINIFPLDTYATPYFQSQQNKHHFEIFFIPPSEDNLTILFKQHHIPLIINDANNSLLSAIHQQTSIHDIYQLPKNMMPRDFFSVSNLPNKSNIIALLGFESLIYNMMENIHHINTLNNKKRYYLSSQMHFLHTVINHSVQTLFIVGKTFDDIHIWQKFFAPFFKIEINSKQLLTYHKPHNEQQYLPNKEIQDYITEIKNNLSIDKSEIEQKIFFYRNNFKFDKACYFNAILYYINDDIDGFFENYGQSSYYEYMLKLLILLNNLPYLNQYKNYLPGKLKAHMLCLQLIDKEIHPKWLEDYEKMVDCISPQKHFWEKFWQECHQKLALKIYHYQDFNQQDYERLYQANQLLIQKNCLYSKDLLAYLNYQLGHYQQAINLWDKAYFNYGIKNYPNEYHQAQIQCLEDPLERIDYLLGFGKNFIIQELSKMNLNELQEEYWQKILEYLNEEDELESVLTHIMPYIDSPDVLQKLYEFCQKLDDMNEESFSSRLLRFQTLQLCLTSDWQAIKTRIEFYQPTNHGIQELQQKFAGQFVVISKSNKAKSRYNIPEELSDILYALENNTQIRQLAQSENFADYQQHHEIIEIFESLKNYFVSETNKEKVVWKTNFNTIKALCHMMELSPDLSMPLSLYTNALSKISSKDNNHQFYVERLRTIINKIRVLNLDDEELQTKVTLAEQQYKHQLQTINTENLTVLLPALKSVSVMMQSILGLTPSENAQIQKLKSEEAKQRAKEEEKERLEKERLEKERLEKERLEKERLEKERLEKERLEKEQTNYDNKTIEEPLTKQETQTISLNAEQMPRHATSEFVFFGLRIFISRTHKRLNIEDTYTGERWSLHHPSQSIQSDWDYYQQDNLYQLTHLQLQISLLDNGVYLWHHEHGIGIHIVF